MSRRPRVLFAGMKWDYGVRERGHAYEYAVMFDAMSRMDDVEVRHVDFMTASQTGGAGAVRKEITDAIAEFDPDLLFCVLFTDELPKDLLVELRDAPRPLTLAWFSDDHWRFDNYSRHWAPLFNACTTTARSALAKYEQIGYQNVIKTQWGCNHHLYRPTGGTMAQTIAFVGQQHGNRAEVISRLRREGLPVSVWGRGWESGRLTQEEMVDVLSTSAINLNLSNASVPAGRRRPWRRHRSLAYGDQIKGRNFEISGCRGFQLSGAADDLENYFEPDREIVLFDSTDDLVDKSRRYLASDDARQRIALAGYERTLAEHTFAHRYRAIFSAVGLT